MRQIWQHLCLCSKKCSFLCHASTKMAPTINVYLVLIASIKSCEFISLIVFHPIFGMHLSHSFSTGSLIQNQHWKSNRPYENIVLSSILESVSILIMFYFITFLFLRLWYSLNNKNESRFYSTEYSLYTKSHAEYIIKHF